MTGTDEQLTFHATAHPLAAVHRAGFPLEHPYVERCWTPILGPSSILLLRRLPELFRSSPDPVVRLDDLGRSLGIGGVGQHSAIRRTVDRLVQFRFGAWGSSGELDIYTEVPPLGPRHLERVPEATRTAHDALLSAHLDALAAPLAPTHARPSLDVPAVPKVVPARPALSR